MSTSTFSWLSRCFGAWQRFVQRGTRYRDHMANRCAGTLRMCLQQWVQMKQLQASDGAQVTQLSLCWQKAGERVAGRGPPSPSHPSKQHHLSSFCSRPVDSWILVVGGDGIGSFLGDAAWQGWEGLEGSLEQQAFVGPILTSIVSSSRRETCSIFHLQEMQPLLLGSSWS